LRDTLTFENLWWLWTLGTEFSKTLHSNQSNTVHATSVKWLTFILRPAAKVTQKFVCNKNLYLTATSIKHPRPSSCWPNGDFVLFYTIKWPARFEVGRFLPNEGKRTTMWNTVKTPFQQYLYGYTIPWEYYFHRIFLFKQNKKVAIKFPKKWKETLKTHASYLGKKVFFIKVNKTVKCHNPRSVSPFCAKQLPPVTLITRASLAFLFTCYILQ